MSVQTALTQVKQRMADIDALGSALALLGWDLETKMPAGAAENRATVSATLCRMAHEQFVDAQMGDWLQTLTDRTLDNPEDTAMIRVLNRAYQREVKVPTRLVEALEMASSHALPVWAKARQTSQLRTLPPCWKRLFS
jgi:carboxypeptidase Taq